MTLTGRLFLVVALFPSALVSLDAQQVLLFRDGREVASETNVPEKVVANRRRDRLAPADAHRSLGKRELT